MKGLSFAMHTQVSCNQRGQNASQPNLAGTGLGSFNDRFRDALVGGSPFGPPRYQGFSTGLATQPSSYMEVSHDLREDEVRHACCLQLSCPYLSQVVWVRLFVGGRMVCAYDWHLNPRT